MLKLKSKQIHTQKCKNYNKRKLSSYSTEPQFKDFYQIIKFQVTIRQTIQLTL